jgi:hypothetical protein
MILRPAGTTEPSILQKIAPSYDHVDIRVLVFAAKSNFHIVAKLMLLR